VCGALSDLIYIHKGYSWYAPLALLNGRRFWTGEVHYIGNTYGCWVAWLCGVKAWPIERFRKSADEFARIYRHHSELGAEFELFCIQRWFILAEFMAARRLDAATYLDTDILLTRNVDGERVRTAAFGLTFTGYSAHLCFINRLTALQRFCAFVTALYADPSSEEKMQEYHHFMVGRYGSSGVSDMALFYWFQKEHPEVLGDYPSIFVDSPFDVSLEEVSGFKSDEYGFKRLAWENGRPFAITTDGRRIDLATLHHQGRGKSRLKEHAGRLGVGFITRSVLVPMAGFAYRVGRKLMRMLDRVTLVLLSTLGELI